MAALLRRCDRAGARHRTALRAQPEAKYGPRRGWHNVAGVGWALCAIDTNYPTFIPDVRQRLRGDLRSNNRGNCADRGGTAQARSDVATGMAGTPGPARGRLQL